MQRRPQRAGLVAHPPVVTQTRLAEMAQTDWAAAIAETEVLLLTEAQGALAEPVVAMAG